MITGCSLTYTIHDPQVSSFQYNMVPEKKLVIRVADQRKDVVFQRPISNLRNITIKLENMDEPIKWFASALEKELTARGIPVTVIANDQPVAADMTLVVKTYQIVSHRMTGFSPWETYHSFRGELTAGDQTSTIIAYFTNGHVPKWSMKEVEKPCFDIPMSIVVKDVASKINQRIFKYRAGNDKLDTINARISEKLAGDSEEACLPAIELGATNNLDGMPILMKLADHKDQFVRACSLSAIGTLGAQNQLDFLKQKFTQYDYVDRFMALKSIGDVGTPEAVDFIKKSRSDEHYKSENGFMYFVNLYLGD
jgi:hypothetical protein